MKPQYIEGYNYTRKRGRIRAFLLGAAIAGAIGYGAGTLNAKTVRLIDYVCTEEQAFSKVETTLAAVIDGDKVRAFITPARKP